MELSERFWDKVDKSGDCWMWMAATTHGGYGQFWATVGGGHNKAASAHRLAYEDAKGKIPEGLQIDHLCRNRACVRPSHLEPVSAKENTRRSPNINRLKTHCPQGHEYDTANTYRPPGGHGWRNCRECKRASLRRYRSLARAPRSQSGLAAAQ